MNDRFKFRFGVTISHYDENDEDIETTIICETEAIFDDGTVGVCKETLENVITSLHLSKERERTLWNSLYEYERIEDWFVLDQDFVEQCTGLKDKNGKLIYEGDIVKFKNDISEVRWCINGFAIDDGVQYLVDDMDIEVIGNIHENKEEG